MKPAVKATVGLLTARLTVFLALATRFTSELTAARFLPTVVPCQFCEGPLL